MTHIPPGPGFPPGTGLLTTGTGGDATLSGALALGGGCHAPVADACLLPGGVQLLIDMPGVDPETIVVSVEDRVLTVEGTSLPPPGFTDRPFLFRERPSGLFRRRFRLPPGADVTAMERVYHNGVLGVFLPFRRTADQAK